MHNEMITTINQINTSSPYTATFFFKRELQNIMTVHDFSRKPLDIFILRKAMWSEFKKGEDVVLPLVNYLVEKPIFRSF